MAMAHLRRREIAALTLTACVCLTAHADEPRAALTRPALASDHSALAPKASPVSASSTVAPSTVSGRLASDTPAVGSAVSGGGRAAPTSSPSAPPLASSQPASRP